MVFENDATYLIMENERQHKNSITGLFKAGSRIIASPGCGSPTTLLKILNRASSNTPDMHLFSGLQIDYSPFYESVDQKWLKYSTWHVMSQMRNLLDAGVAEYIPAKASQIPSLIKKWKIDTALVRISPKDQKGFHSLGATGSYMCEAVKSCPTVIAEIDEDVPHTFGNLIHESLISTCIKSKEKMPEYKIGSNTGDSEEIAAHIIKLIPQNSTLQIGIGSISESVMSQLLQSNLESLRFAGMGCDPMSDMFDSGQLANNTSDQNPAILSVELMGTRKIMNFAHENPLVSVVSSEVGHNAYHLGNIKNFISINSAIEVDLTGQINSETVGLRQISGVGGSLDFTEAATRSAGGISITALSSSAKNGTISRIVPNLAFGSAVTIPRSMSGIIVTERGVADMRGKSNSERARALIEICHPDHRNELSNSVTQKRTL